MLKSVDAVVIGLGWTGAILARELTKAGLDVVALERGGDRRTVPDFQAPHAHDELDHSVRYKLMQDVSRETVTFRNNANQRALPMRRLGAFLPGTGVGGAGVHWSGAVYRYTDVDFKPRSHFTGRYGAKQFAPDLTTQDWPVTYADMEPYYDRFERLIGASGRAGNIKGTKQDGGNPFEAPRSRDFPNPPLQVAYASALFGTAAEKLGYHPFVQPAGLSSRPYVNSEGLRLQPCNFCGFCSNYGCEHFSKASPQTCVLPKLEADQKFEKRVGATVTKINLSQDGKRAVSVTYRSGGQEYTQPADLVLLCAFPFNNARLLLLSGIGEPYDPATGAGVVGRNFAYQTTGSADCFFGPEVRMNPFMGAGAAAVTIDDFNGDNFDRGGLDFVGGGYIQTQVVGAGPIKSRPVPADTPRWGADWKAATRQWYNHNAQVIISGSSQPTRTNYLSLDPTFRDSDGLPLLRMTFDFSDNDVALSAFLVGKCAEIGRAMGARIVEAKPRKRPFSIVPYQTTHVVGGTAMGSDPGDSVVNRFGQHWDVSNLFIAGASLFPQNSAYNPTLTVGASTYWIADALTGRYLKSPGRLA